MDSPVALNGHGLRLKIQELRIANLLLWRSAWWCVSFHSSFTKSKEDHLIALAAA
jgi:hypothetical protein